MEFAWRDPSFRGLLHFRSNDFHNVQRRGRGGMADAAVLKTVGKPCGFESRRPHPGFLSIGQLIDFTRHCDRVGRLASASDDAGTSASGNDCAWIGLNRSIKEGMPVDDNRLDMLAKTAAGGSRRGLLKASVGAAVGGALGLAGLKSASAARKRAYGAICRTGSDCQSDYCYITDEKHHRGYCAAFCEVSLNRCDID